MSRLRTLAKSTNKSTKQVRKIVKKGDIIAKRVGSPKVKKTDKSHPGYIPHKHH